ncbi:MAG: class I SAM-dependent methyltransferase [Prevotella sp.]|jgi:SAM-dependent methyltransferase|nr:class I SAM-dependent methyltransferase [Prevotella sp.]
MPIMQKKYWDNRKNLSYIYKGESYYTITPIPYYLKRRNILLHVLAKQMSCLETGGHVQDFGCGDGWYLNYFYKLFPNLRFSGFDISKNFISKARSVLSSDISLYCGDTDNHSAHQHDLVYAIAVFAHILDEQKVLHIFMDINKTLKKHGKFIIFEQTSGEEFSVRAGGGGGGYVRRLAAEYVMLAYKAGFVNRMKVTVDFFIHRYFERCIAKNIYRFFPGDNQEEKRINANKNGVFRLLSNLACLLSFDPIRNGDKNYWGNTFFVFEKV